MLLEKGSVGNYERSVYWVPPILTISVVGPSSRRLESSYPRSTSLRNKVSSASFLSELDKSVRLYYNLGLESGLNF